MKVFVLQHASEGDDGSEDIKLIGVYATATDAELARDRSARLPGFSDHSDGFSIDAYELGRDHWASGFVSVPPVAGQGGREQAA
jgi:hypothetical protein